MFLIAFFAAVRTSYLVHPSWSTKSTSFFTHLFCLTFLYARYTKDYAKSRILVYCSRIQEHVIKGMLLLRHEYVLFSWKILCLYTWCGGWDSRTSLPVKNAQRIGSWVPKRVWRARGVSERCIRYALFVLLSWAFSVCCMLCAAYALCAVCRMATVG